MVLEGSAGILTTLILATVIGYLTYRGFRHGVAEIKEGTCCGGSGSCTCNGNCGNVCNGNENLKQKPGEDSKSGNKNG